MTSTMDPLAAGIEPSSIDIIRSALRGDEEAFEEVIRLYSRPLYLVAYQIVQNAAQAEDIVQETFWAAHRNRWRLFNPAKIPAWLATVARNKARDVWRKRVRQATDSLEETAEAQLPENQEGSPSGQLEDSEREQILRTLLSSLPEQWRVVITLRYMEGMDHAAIEAQMGLSNGAVRGILGRALSRLRENAAPHRSEFRN